MATMPNETTTTKVVTDATQTINELGKLQLSYKELEKSIKDITGRTKTDREQKKKLKEEASLVKKQIDQLNLSLGTQAMSYTQLNRAARDVRMEMGRMNPAMEGYATKMKELILREKELKEAIDVRKKSMSFNPPPENKGWWGNAKQALSDKKGSFLAGLGGAAVVGSIAGLAVGFGTQIYDTVMQKAAESITRAAQKSAALSSMAAITGLDLKKDAADLRFYGDAAEYMAKKFNMSVPDVVEAMQKIGSKKPELLGVKEALAGIAEQAITLARADGQISIEGAVEALVGSLNQFDKGADQSVRFMNVLAASASAGNAEINQLAESFKVSGAIMSASNVSFEETNALLQVLAKREIVGSEAGTALRNVFTKLMVSGKEINPTIVGVNTALENLSKLTPQEMVKLFGQENLVAAMTLVDLRKEVQKLAEEMTGTTEATDQARKRMTNLDEDMTSLGKSWDRMFDLDADQAGTFQKLVQWLTGVFDWIGDIRKAWQGTFSLEGFGPKFMEAKERATENRRRTAQNEGIKEARQQGNADYYEGTKESNLNKFAGATVADRRIAYAKKTLADAQKTRIQLQNEMKQLQKSDPVKADKVFLNLAKISSTIQTAQRDILDIEKGKITTAKRVEKILEGQEKADADKKKREADKAKKHQEDLAKQEIQNLNTIAENKIQAIEKEEERELWMRQLQYSKEMQEAVKQEGDKTDLYKSLEERLQLDLQRIRKKYADKRKEEELETAVRLADATRDLQYQEAQNWVRQAESKANNQQEVFNARYNLSLVQEEQELARLTAFHEKEKEKYKGNDMALANLELAFQKQIYAIKKKGMADRQLLTEEDLRTQRSVDRANKQRQLGNDLREAELGGGGRAMLDAHLALLDSQMQAELDVTNLTEEQKNEIIRGYMIERDAMVRQFNREQAVGWLEIFQAGIQGIAQLSAMRFQNEETRSNDAKAREDKRLDDQLKKGTITQEQYNKLKEKSDERYEKKQRELRRRKAEAEKKAALFEAAIQIPLAILKALPNPFAVAVASIAGAAQLAVIAGTEIPEYAAGGPVGGKWGEGKIIRAGEKGTEWVMPHWQTMDPATRPTLEWLEERRLSGTKGYQGTPPPGSATPAGTDPLLLQTVARMSGVIAELSGKLDNIHSKIYTDQLDRHYETQQSIMNDANVK